MSTAPEPGVPDSSQPHGSAARVVVYTRTDCHLCDDALGVVERVCTDLGERWTTQDVDASASLRAAYSDYVPVLLVDGVQQGFWRVDEARLRRLLSA